MTSLQSLPVETISHITEHLPPYDYPPLAHTSRKTRAAVFHRLSLDITRSTSMRLYLSGDAVSAQTLGDNIRNAVFPELQRRCPLQTPADSFWYPYVSGELNRDTFWYKDHDRPDTHILHLDWTLFCRREGPLYHFRCKDDVKPFNVAVAHMQVQAHLLIDIDWASGRWGTELERKWRFNDDLLVCCGIDDFFITVPVGSVGSGKSHLVADIDRDDGVDFQTEHRHVIDDDGAPFCTELSVPEVRFRADALTSLMLQKLGKLGGEVRKRRMEWEAARHDVVSASPNLS